MKKFKIEELEQIVAPAFLATILPDGYYSNFPIYGTNANDILNGTSGGYIIANDTIYGLAGNDRIQGWRGDDLVYGGKGNDIIYGNHLRQAGEVETQDLYTDNDKLYGDAGNDIIYGQEGQDRLYGGSGNDKLYGQEGQDFLKGDTGNDRLEGGVGDDILKGGVGTDTYIYNNGDGADVIYGDNKDVLIMKGIKSTDVEMWQNAMPMLDGDAFPAYIKIDDNNSITIHESVKEIQFADKTIKWADIPRVY